MAPPARSPGSRSAGSRVEAGGATSLPHDAGGPAWGLPATASAILASAFAARRGRRVLVGGVRAAPVSRSLCTLLARSARCLWLDLTARAGEGYGLSHVVAGTASLSRAIVTREGGFDRLHGGNAHPDSLVDRPHGLAIALEALSFAYEVVVMSAPERDESLVAEVLAAISDDAVLAGDGHPEADRLEALSFAARGAGRVGILAPDGRATWLGGERPVRVN